MRLRWIVLNSAYRTLLLPPRACTNAVSGRDTTAVDPGRPTPTSPDGCFVLKLGTPVRGSYGEGLVVGAQCTPGELTQYRIEKPDGERFWAQRDELNAP